MARGGTGGDPADRAGDYTGLFCDTSVSMLEREARKRKRSGIGR